MTYWYSGCGSLLPSFARLSAFSFPLMPQWAGIHCTIVVAVLASWFKVCLSLSVTSSVGVDCRVCSAESESDRKTIFVGISLRWRRQSAAVWRALSSALKFVLLAPHGEVHMVNVYVTFKNKRV